MAIVRLLDVAIVRLLDVAIVRLLDVPVVRLLDVATPDEINDLTPDPAVNHGCATVNHCGGWRWSMPMVYDCAVTAHR